MLAEWIIPQSSQTKPTSSPQHRRHSNFQLALIRLFSYEPVIMTFIHIPLCDYKLISNKFWSR